MILINLFQKLSRGGAYLIKNNIFWSTKEYQKRIALYLRNFVFGAEDSLVSTVGLLSGINVAGTTKNSIVIAGIILIFVEAFSMGIGSLLSEHSAQEFLRKKELPWQNTMRGGLVMFASYFMTGFIPLAPYFFTTPSQAIYWSIGLSLVALFILGIVSGKIFNNNLFKHGLQMLLIGGLAILIGVTVGKLLQVS